VEAADGGDVRLELVIADREGDVVRVDESEQLVALPKEALFATPLPLYPRTMPGLHVLRLAALALSLAACSSPNPGDGGLDADAAPDTATPDVPEPTGPAAFVFDLAADTTSSRAFYDLPYPSDLRLSASQTPDLRGFPASPRAYVLPPLLQIAQQRPRFPTVPVAYFRFTAPLATQDPEVVIPAQPDARILLIDTDPRSPDRGQLVPTVASTPAADEYLPAHVLAVAARPGFVLHPDRTYAFVVMRTLGDAQGRPLVAPAAFEQLKAGQAPAGDRGAAALALYRPLFETLRMRGIDVAQVAAATVFTTGDVVRETAELTDRVLARYTVSLEDLRLVTSNTNSRYCQFAATVTFPQFQQGTPPFNTEGLFSFGTDGLPTPVTYPTLPDYARVPVTLTLPRREMPAAGYPLVVYFHGSGGVSTAVVDRGTWRPRSATHPCPQGTDTYNGVAGCNTLGEGPAYVLAARGFATAGAAMPVNPERLPGAGETAYLNTSNLAAFRDTFRQGVIEQRLLIRALAELRIPHSLVTQCTGASLPTGVTEARFDTSRLIAQGQSMGGMYTNLVSATEPRVRAAIPTGAGGYWSYFILQTQLVPGVRGFLALVLGTRAPLTFMHPALMLLETAWEAADPLVYMPRLARRPLPGHPVRSVYEPVGQGDSYFPTTVYDAVALAYGHRQAGTEVWPTMQPALRLAGLDGLLPYPVSNDVRGAGDTPYTGVVVQYAGDGVYDPHAIYSQLDAVKYQYSCFAESFVRTGTAVVPDPTNRAADAPCGM
jgi:hypothetical protein